ncbi:MAG TPA: hypothetical protein VHE53_00485 [Patescibacteria group bacterium]|nr:hypothetical protein [Patescibacteria group bacterium]
MYLLKITTSQYEIDTELKRGFTSLFTLPTLSDEIKLVVYPYLVDEPTENNRKQAEIRGLEVANSGPQVAIYVLDGFEDEQANLAFLGANLTYVNDVVNAIVNKTRPWNLSWGDFRKETYEALIKVREFVVGLPESRRQTLPFDIRKLGGQSNSQLLMETEIILGHNPTPYQNMTSSEQFFGDNKLL